MQTSVQVRVDVQRCPPRQQCSMIMAGNASNHAWCRAEKQDKEKTHTNMKSSSMTRSSTG